MQIWVTARIHASFVLRKKRGLGSKFVLFFNLYFSWVVIFPCTGDVVIVSLVCIKICFYQSCVAIPSSWKSSKRGSPIAEEPAC